jgi:hypothetical protein
MYIGQLKRVENPEIDADPHHKLFSNKEAKRIQ